MDQTQERMYASSLRFKPGYVEQCSLEVLALGLLVVNLFQHKALPQKRFTVVEESLGVLVHELQAELALGHLPLVSRSPHSLQNGPLWRSKLLLLATNHWIDLHKISNVITCVGVMADT